MAPHRLRAHSSFLYVSHAKHCRHIRIMTPSASSAASSGHHAFGFRSIVFEGMNQLHSKFTEE